MLMKKGFKNTDTGDFHKNPFFYFGLISVILLGVVSFGSDSLAKLNAMETVAFNGTTIAADNSDLYFNQHGATSLETPDLKTSEGAFVYGVATPHVFTTQTLGAVMGGQDPIQSRTEPQAYDVEVGDSPQSIADKFGLNVNTILWANDLSKNSILKNGQSLIIPQADGILYVVKAGDTLEGIAKKYNVDAQEIMDANGLTGSQVFFGDILFLPGAKPIAKKPTSIAASVSVNVLPDSFFIFPLLRFKITQGLHYYNGIDISSLDGAGSPVYAAAGGVVQHADYDKTGGNRVTILHDNGVVTYYGHLASIMVKPGQQVTQGQQIGSEGQTGKATGPHVHFQVMGAANFIAKYKVGTVIDVTKK